MRRLKHYRYRPAMDDYTWGQICRNADAYWNERKKRCGLPLKKICKHPGCSELIDVGQAYCAKHRIDQREYDRRRGSPSKRGYDDRWERLRKLYLHANPLCEDCLEQDTVTLAEQVHHKRKVSEHPELRLCWDNLRALCAPCHSKRTARGE